MFTRSTRYLSTGDTPYPHMRQRDSRVTTTLRILNSGGHRIITIVSSSFPVANIFHRTPSKVIAIHIEQLTAETQQYYN